MDFTKQVKAQEKVTLNTHAEHFLQAQKKDKEITTLQHNLMNAQTSLELEQREKDNLVRLHTTPSSLPFLQL